MNREDEVDATAIQLDKHEALVLFELLARWLHDGQQPLVPDESFEHVSEKAVLHSLLAQLERQLVEPFKADYGELLDKARHAVKDAWDGPTDE